jgi:hypothetical protein
VQSLLEYRSRPAVEKSLKNHKFRYAVKVLLIEQNLTEFDVSSIEPLEIQLGCLQRGLLIILKYLPAGLKKMLRKKFLIF